MAGSDIGPDGPCAQCGDAFPRAFGRGRPKKYCSAQCANRAALDLASSAKRAKTQAERQEVSHCQRCAKPLPVGRRGKIAIACSTCRSALYREAEGEKLRVRARERQILRARASGVVPFEQFQRERTKASIERRSSVCGWCGVSFVARSLDRLSYCSRQCGGRAVGAEKSRRAAESAQPFTPVRFGQCGECDKPIVARMGRTVCSSECATKRAKRSEAAKVERARAAFKPRLFACAECSKSCATEYGKPRTRFCSDECGRRATKRTSRKRERARLRLAKVEAVDPLKVFERDGWRCQMCRVATPRRYKGTTHQRAPELDHITALAKGGDHSYRNTQLLCRACNGAKSDRDVGQQMRLFG